MNRNHLAIKTIDQDAELLLREWISLREEQGADNWIFFYHQSTLGSILAEQKKYTEAEPLLLAGYKGVDSSTPKPQSKWGRFCIDRLVRLYTDWSKPVEAAKWQAKLNALEAPKEED